VWVVGCCLGGCGLGGGWVVGGGGFGLLVGGGGLWGGVGWVGGVVGVFDLTSRSHSLPLLCALARELHREAAIGDCCIVMLLLRVMLK